MTEFKAIGLGDRAKDPITGLTGIVVCVTTWLHGCIRLGIQAEEVKDGKPTEAVYFDQSQLVLVEAGVHEPMMMAVVPAPAELAKPKRRSNGGPSREGVGHKRS